MRGIARTGIDRVDGTGIIITGLNTLTFTNGKPFAVLGDRIAPHPPYPEIPIHGFAKIITGSNILFMNGKPAARLGDLATCGHPINTGDNLVFSD